jgi:hypothetical protein
LLEYIFVCSANKCHISSSINFWKHSRTRFIVKIYIQSTYTEKYKSWTCHAMRYKRLRKIWHFFMRFTLMHNTACLRLIVWIFLTCIKQKSSDSSENVTFVFFV